MSIQDDALDARPASLVTPEKDQLSGTGAPKSVTVRKRNNKRRTNYAELHKDALPLEVFPLPVFHPTNPLSVLNLIWTCIRQTLYPPQSQPAERYQGYLSTDTRSVHVTNPKHIRALWERGFFGKGTLSRSEPSWMNREKARLAAQSTGGQTAEEATKARREERRLFKLERARLESERIQHQKLREQGIEIESEMPSDPLKADTIIPDHDTTSPTPHTSVARQADLEDEVLDADMIITDQEHLQLTLEEAYFLSFGLGVLDIDLTDAGVQSDSRDALATLSLFTAKTASTTAKPSMDDQFLLNYVVYHHFRSLGWVVRPGVKFSCDFMLYNRGPVFSHAEFAVLIMPSYTHSYWSTSQGQSQRAFKEQRDWWWLHCINRVQSQVKKTLVLCYVDIPPPSEDIDSPRALFSRYKVREIILRRWIMNRQRD